MKANRIGAAAAGLVALAGAPAGAQNGPPGQCDPRWIPGPALNGQVHAMTLWDSDGMGSDGDRLILGGLFTQGQGFTANRIASWEGAAWAPLSTGMDRVVYSLAHFRGELIAGGWFHIAGGVPVSHIASWDGRMWAPLDEGLGCCVRALTSHDGDLYAGGSFPSAGRLTVNGVARWDGAQWHSLAGGVGGGFPVSTVYALASLRGEELVAGGNFTTAGGVPASFIGAWSGGAWRALGEGMDGPVYTLLEFNGDLIAGGDFTRAGGETARYLARWDGVAWRELGGGTSGPVLALGLVGGRLAVGGGFQFAGGVEVNHVALWTGGAWEPLGQGADCCVTALAAFGPELLVGGSFATAGGLSSPNWARWASSGQPWIARHPASVEVPPLETVEFSVAAAEGYGPLEFRWRRDGTPISDGPGGASPGGGEVAGAATPRLRILSARRSDGGGYDCLVTNACGAAASHAATLSFTCYADCDPIGGPGVLDIFDFLCFQNRYAAGDPYACDCDTTTGPGVCDVFDFLCFQNAFAAGCN